MILDILICVIGIVLGMVIEGLIRGRNSQPKLIAKAILDDTILPLIQDRLPNADKSEYVKILYNENVAYSGYDYDEAYKVWKHLENNIDNNKGTIRFYRHDRLHAEVEL